MEKINPTTIAAVKMLEAATRLMIDNKENLNDIEREILDILIKTRNETSLLSRLNERTEMPCEKSEKIYTDGACSGNPGPGGWSMVRILEGKNVAPQIASKGFRHTTNNRMELMAVIHALSLFRVSKTRIEIISDSKYVVDAITKGWLKSWAKEGFDRPANPDLWRQLYALLKEVKKEHEVIFTWVKGHAGNKYNEMADKLAVEAIENDQKEADVYYETV